VGSDRIPRARRPRGDALANRLRVLEVASQVFATRGLSASLADVASAADVGIGTLYRGFQNKDELIYVVYEPQMRASQLMAAQAAELADPWTGLVWFIEESARNLARDIGFRQFILGRHVEADGWPRSEKLRELAKLLEETHDCVMRHMSDVVDRAKWTGQLRPDFEVTDIPFITVAVQSAVEFGRPDNSDMHRRLIGMILDGLRSTRSVSTPLPVPGLSVDELRHLGGRRANVSEQS